MDNFTEGDRPATPNAPVPAPSGPTPLMVGLILGVVALIILGCLGLVVLAVLLPAPPA